MKSAILAVLALLALAAPAKAGGSTAGNLLKMCVSPVPESQTACKFYIMGAVHGFVLGDSAALASDGKTMVEKPNTWVCLPATVQTADQMVAIFLETANLEFTMFPGDMELDAPGVLIAMFHNKFPCNRAKAR
jgi:hypothetical protein